MSGAIAILIALLLAVLLLVGGQHGPARHAPDGFGAAWPSTAADSPGGGEYPTSGAGPG